jgi:DNA-binding XRE family transcriptional regulator
MANKMGRKTIETFSDYMNDETRVDPAEREQINFETALIGKMIEAREQKGMSQRELAEASGVQQPAIARLESLKATPQIDTLFKVLHPLGYTIEIVPLGKR